MFCAPDNGGRWWRLEVKGVPQVRFSDKGDRLVTALGNGGKAVELRVVRTSLRTEVHVVVRHPPREVADGVSPNPVGIDLGLSSRLTLSNGDHVAAREVDRKPIVRAQWRLSRAQKGSRGRFKKRHSLAKAWRREKERAI